MTRTSIDGWGGDGPAKRQLTTRPKSPTPAGTTAVWLSPNHYLDRMHWRHWHTGKCSPKIWPRKTVQPPNRFVLDTSRQKLGRVQAKFRLLQMPTRPHLRNPWIRSAPVPETRCDSIRGACCPRMRAPDPRQVAQASSRNTSKHRSESFNQWLFGVASRRGSSRSSRQKYWFGCDRLISMRDAEQATSAKRVILEIATMGASQQPLFDDR